MLQGGRRAASESGAPNASTGNCAANGGPAAFASGIAVSIADQQPVRTHANRGGASEPRGLAFFGSSSRPRNADDPIMG